MYSWHIYCRHANPHLRCIVEGINVLCNLLANMNFSVTLSLEELQQTTLMAPQGDHAALLLCHCSAAKLKLVEIGHVPRTEAAKLHVRLVKWHPAAKGSIPTKLEQLKKKGVSQVAKTFDYAVFTKPASVPDCILCDANFKPHVDAVYQAAASEEQPSSSGTEQQPDDALLAQLDEAEQQQQDSMQSSRGKCKRGKSKHSKSKHSSKNRAEHSEQQKKGHSTQDLSSTGTSVQFSAGQGSHSGAAASSSQGTSSPPAEQLSPKSQLTRSLEQLKSSKRNEIKDALVKIRKAAQGIQVLCRFS